MNTVLTTAGATCTCIHPPMHGHGAVARSVPVYTCAAADARGSCGRALDRGMHLSSYLWISKYLDPLELGPKAYRLISIYVGIRDRSDIIYVCKSPLISIYTIEWTTGTAVAHFRRRSHSCGGLLGLAFLTPQDLHHLGIGEPLRDGGA